MLSQYLSIVLVEKSVMLEVNDTTEGSTLLDTWSKPTEFVAQKLLFSKFVRHLVSKV